MSPVRQLFAGDAPQVVRGLALTWGGTQHLLPVAHGVYDPRNGGPIDLEVLRLDASLNVIGRTTLFSADRSYYFVSNAGWNGTLFAVGWAQSRDGLYFKPLGARVTFVDFAGFAGTSQWIDQIVPPPASTPPSSRRRGAGH